MEDGTEEVEDMFGTVISGTSAHSWGEEWWTIAVTL